MSTARPMSVTRCAPALLVSSGPVLPIIHMEGVFQQPFFKNESYGVSYNMSQQR